jgi:hypothetical protein
VRWAKQITRDRFYVEEIYRGEVCLGNGEYELEMPAERYRRLFGQRHMKPGYIVTVVVKVGADGKSRMRGWPYKRKWTAEEIAEAERKAAELAAALNME